jgi:hypothetical protein
MTALKVLLFVGVAGLYVDAKPGLVVITPGMNCTECLNLVNTMKNNTEGLMKFVEGIERVCEKVYGPAAKQCVNITHNIDNGFHYLNSHNASYICKDYHYC